MSIDISQIGVEAGLVSVIVTFAGKWLFATKNELAVSATYILDENQKIIWRHFNPDYKVRASLEDILKQL